MAIVDTSFWRLFETRSATAFLVAGVLWLADTMLLALELFRGISVLGTPGLVNPVLYLSGLLATLVGLLGFYPRLHDRVPRLARGSALVGALGAGAVPLLLGWAVTAAALGRPLPPGILLIGTVLLVVLGFFLFGLASAWTGVPSRTVGVLLLGVVATLFGGIALVYIVYGGNSPDWTSPAIGVGMSVFLLAIGVTLRSTPRRAEQVERSADSTV